MLLVIHKLGKYRLSNNFYSMFLKFPCSKFLFFPLVLYRRVKKINCRVEQEVNFTGNTFPTFTEPVSLQIGRNITITFTKKA